jgi:hypothetical protein
MTFQDPYLLLACGKWGAGYYFRILGQRILVADPATSANYINEKGLLHIEIQG